MTNTETTPRTQDDLITARNELAENLFYSDSDAFPGSAAWREQNAAGEALEDFDAEHPEIIVAIRAAKDAEHQAAINDALAMAD